MKRSGILVVLCLAFGAVRAEAQSRTPQVGVFPGSGPVYLGSHHPCVALLPNVQVGSDLHFLMGVSGSSVVPFGNVQVNLLLANPVLLLSAKVKGGSWFGRLPVPDDPSLVGLPMQLGAVAVDLTSSATVSALVPFGPIIEDSIQ